MRVKQGRKAYPRTWRGCEGLAVGTLHDGAWWWCCFTGQEGNCIGCGTGFSYLLQFIHICRELVYIYQHWFHVWYLLPCLLRNNFILWTAAVLGTTLDNLMPWIILRTSTMLASLARSKWHHNGRIENGCEQKSFHFSLVWGEVGRTSLHLCINEYEWVELWMEEKW